MAETITGNIVTREHLDLRLGELEARLRVEIAGVRAEIPGLRAKIRGLRAEISDVRADLLKWVIGAIGFQTVIIIGAVAGLIRLLHRAMVVNRRG
jgi:hypothetical protein